MRIAQWLCAVLLLQLCPVFAAEPQNIIKILYNGRDADLKELEAVQAAMTPQEQIERRIALISATLSEKSKTDNLSQPGPSPPNKEP